MVELDVDGKIGKRHADRCSLYLELECLYVNEPGVEDDIVEDANDTIRTGLEYIIGNAGTGLNLVGFDYEVYHRKDSLMRMEVHYEIVNSVELPESSTPVSELADGERWLEGDEVRGIHFNSENFHSVHEYNVTSRET